MTKAELIEVARWKAARAIGYISADDAEIRTVTAAAFAQEAPRLANWILCYLNGVNVRMASAILTVWDPLRYTVMDVRVIQTLKILDFEEPDIASPTWLDGDPYRSWKYEEYVMLCRQIAEHLGVKLRDLDRALWALNGQELND